MSDSNCRCRGHGAVSDAPGRDGCRASEPEGRAGCRRKGGDQGRMHNGGDSVSSPAGGVRQPGFPFVGTGADDRLRKDFPLSAGPSRQACCASSGSAAGTRFPVEGTGAAEKSLMDIQGKTGCAVPLPVPADCSVLQAERRRELCGRRPREKTAGGSRKRRQSLFRTRKQRSSPGSDVPRLSETEHLPADLSGLSGIPG